MTNLSELQIFSNDLEDVNSCVNNSESECKDDNEFEHIEDSESIDCINANISESINCGCKCSEFIKIQRKDGSQIVDNEREYNSEYANSECQYGR